jgi:hypothetical protein
VVDDNIGFFDVLPHELVIVGREDGAAAAVQQVLGHAVSNGTPI